LGARDEDVWSQREFRSFMERLRPKGGFVLGIKLLNSGLF
jgi:hypothetical protein